VPKSGDVYCPDKGDIIWIDLDPTKGREQQGRRPALVLTPRSYNERAKRCVLCPITSHARDYPFEIPIPTGHAITGTILADQVRSLSWPERYAKFAMTAPADVLEDTCEKIAALLSIG
jgi:mRNA interferase MazF